MFLIHSPTKTCLSRCNETENEFFAICTPLYCILSIIAEGYSVPTKRDCLESKLQFTSGKIDQLTLQKNPVLLRCLSLNYQLLSQQSLYLCSTPSLLMEAWKASYLRAFNLSLDS